MKDSLRPGVSAARRLVVDKERTIAFMGEGGRVYATPSLIHDIEHTCRDCIQTHADTNEDSVGIEVSIRHVAPTLPDMTVEIVATVVAVDGRKVVFDIVARDDVEQIALGQHTRFVVDVAKTVERLKTKAAKRAAVVS